MKIGVVGGEMERRSTGVGRYLTGLLHGLSRWDHGAEWWIFLQGDPFEHPLWQHRGFRAVYSGHRGHPVAWEQLLLPWQIRRCSLDVMFCPAYAVPLGLAVPAVVTLHDLSFELFPEEFGLRERWRRRILARRASRVARRVLVDTPRMVDEVRRCYGLPGDRIGVVPVAVEPGLLGRPGNCEDELTRIGVRPPYLLAVGTILDRRMPRLMLETAASLMAQHPDLQLVLAGENRLRRPDSLAAWSDQLAIADRVRHLGWVPDELLPDLYHGAELGLYLSRYEGFGIPPLESLAFGTPVVIGPGLALDEDWPDYPYRVSTFELDEVVRTARRILEDRAEAVRVVARGADIISARNWEASSRQLVAELQRAVAP